MSAIRAGGFSVVSLAVLFPQSVSIKHEISLIIASCVITAFCSFASLVGGTCGPSPENSNVVHFVDFKNCNRDVKADLKFCNILTNVENVNSERKLLLARASKVEVWHFFYLTKEQQWFLSRDIHRSRMPAAHDGLSKAQGCLW